MPNPAETDPAVLEVAILDVIPARRVAFETDFGRAQAILAASPGYRWHALRRCHESPSRYLLLVGWDSVEAHTEGFRGSAGYDEWKALLHRYYDPFPRVEHYLRPLVAGWARSGRAGPQTER